MNHSKIYEYRFSDVNHEKKQIVWKEVADYLYQLSNQPETVLDPASGMCEFINNVPSKEKWAVDLNENFIDKYADKSVRKIIGNNLDVDLPQDYFDLVFISNFLEHLESQEQVAEFLGKMFQTVKPGGFIAVMGPNFKYAFREYFDFADHTVCLSELGVAEHLVGSGFTISKIYPQFLPLSFRGGLPVNKFLIQTYLRLPFAWRFFGKQFLLIAQK
jgi:ubiquinone/menaquinone biosynthesis C-methylase UbiE